MTRMWNWSLTRPVSIVTGVPGGRVPERVAHDVVETSFEQRPVGDDDAVGRRPA